jgi:hypothetical protein
MALYVNTILAAIADILAAERQSRNKMDHVAVCRFIFAWQWMQEWLSISVVKAVEGLTLSIMILH